MQSSGTYSASSTSSGRAITPLKRTKAILDSYASRDGGVLAACKRHRQAIALCRIPPAPLSALVAFSHMGAMAASGRITLPYGLSAAHRHARETGKGLASTLGDHRFSISTLRDLCDTPTRDNPPDTPRTVGLQLSKTTKRRTRKMGIKRTRTKCPQFAKRSMKLTWQPKEARARTPKSKSQSAHEARQGSRRMSRQATREPTFGPGTRLLPGDLPHAPLIIEDSDRESEVELLGIRSVTPEMTPQPQNFPMPRINTTNWPEVAPSSATTIPDLERYRYDPPTPNRSGTLIDHITNIFQIGHGFKLKRELASFDIPVRSYERQRVSK